MIHWIGIDPGLEGAVVHLDEHLSFVSAFKTPVHRAESGKGKTQYAEREMANQLNHMLCEARARGATPRVCIEDVHAAPTQGVASMFRFGYGYGLWCGIVANSGAGLFRIKPQMWQRVAYAGRSHEDKKLASVTMARELWPGLPIRSKSADSGLSDAALIAWSCGIQTRAATH